MMDSVHGGPWRMGADFNPFCVQRHGPGNILYVFRSEGQRERLESLLREGGWRLELVGDFGVGKSTLLTTMEGWARREGMETVRLRCSEDTPRLPWVFWRLLPRRGGVVFLDGGECCPRWQLWLLAWVTRARGSGLVLTAHRRLGVARAIRVRTSAMQLQSIVESLLERPLDEEARVRLRRLLQSHEGSAREAIFALYDDWEERAGPSLISARG